ncbi:jg26585 [Pararge aegeria aegeria]|uniref:Jg26585 protein n=1 Tax=Pararge aegeria aegeria TaxID=348720 RepID=A0A8S4QQH1_9NEOP|nr:jg26585 [Pararge aegeria aegeria]
MAKICRKEMGKQDSGWRRVCAVLCVLVLCCESVCAKQMSETLQRALSAVRGPSPGAKKLLNIPEDGGKSSVI